MFTRIIAPLALAIASLVTSKVTLADEHCGEVSIASLNWASAEIMAEIDRIILSAGFGCKAELSSTDSVPILEALALSEDARLVPELWVDTILDEIEVEIAAGRVIAGTRVLADGGEEGWWMPRYIADAHPDIKTVEDALKHPELFAQPEDPALGVVHNCPAVWACNISTSNLFRAFDAEVQGFTLMETTSAADLDASIARAYEAETGWLGYYWSPTALLGRYDMVKLSGGVYDSQEWASCISQADCDNPEVTGWPTAQAMTLVSDEFVERAAPAMSYISTRQWGNETVNHLLAWTTENQASGEEAAYYFLENFQPIWNEWVSDEVVLKVRAWLPP